MFWWSPQHDWQAVNVSQKAGQEMAGDDELADAERAVQRRASRRPEPRRRSDRVLVVAAARLAGSQRLAESRAEGGRRRHKLADAKRPVQRRASRRTEPGRRSDRLLVVPATRLAGTQTHRGSRAGRVGTPGVVPGSRCRRKRRDARDAAERSDSLCTTGGSLASTGKWRISTKLTGAEGALGSRGLDDAVLATMSSSILPARATATRCSCSGSTRRSATRGSRRTAGCRIGRRNITCVILALAAHPTEPGRCMPARNSEGVEDVQRRARRGHRRWTALINPCVTALALLTDSSRIRLRRNEPRQSRAERVPRSTAATTAAQRWTPRTQVASTFCPRLRLHPTNPDILYYAGDRGLHKTTDGGATWTRRPRRRHRRRQARRR